MAEIIDTFLEDAPDLVANMRKGVDQGNAADLRIAAHSLKSNSADFGAETLRELCKQAELLGKMGELDGADNLVSRAASEYAAGRDGTQDAAQRSMNRRIAKTGSTAYERRARRVSNFGTLMALPMSGNDPACVKTSMVL